MRQFTRNRAGRRRGVAAVEAAVVLAVLLAPLLLGVWEIGRLVHAQQVVANAAREGARLCAQARTVQSTGAAVEIKYSSAVAGEPNLKETVFQALATGGLRELTRSDVTTKFGFTASETPSTAPTRQPYQGVKNERFRVSVSIPFAKVRWINLSLINPSTVDYQVDWQMLVDDPFTVNTNLPNW